MSPPGRDQRTIPTQDELDARGEFYVPTPMAVQASPFYSYTPSPLLPPRPHARRSRTGGTGRPHAPPPAPIVPSPFERPGLWDTFTIAGVLFLGLVEIDGEVGNEVQSKKHGGRDGGRNTDKGATAAEFPIVFRVWDAVTWASWNQVFRAINPRRPVEERGPVDVTHPALAEKGIRRVYVEKVSFPKRSGQEYHFTVKVKEDFPSTPDRQGRSVTRTPVRPAQTAFTGYGANQAAVDAWARSEGITAPLNDTAFTGLTPPSNDPEDTDTGP